MKKNAEELFQEGRKLLTGSADDLLRAEAYFRDAAEQGNAEAQYQLAMMCLGVERRAVFKEGSVLVGKERDVYPDEGFCWLVKSADGGCVEAQCEMRAICLGTSAVIKRQKCEEAVDPKQELMSLVRRLMGVDLEWDENVKDPDSVNRGIDLLKVAANWGIVEAQYRYGRLCMFSDAYDIYNGFAVLEKAAAAGCMAAADLLRNCYFSPDYCGGLEQERAERLAFEYSLMAAEAGFVYSQCRLCYMYAVGCGVGRNEVEARRWLDTSCESPFTPTLFARRVSEDILFGRSISGAVEAHLQDLLTVLDAPGTFVRAMASDVGDGGCNSKQDATRTVLCTRRCDGSICGLLHRER